MSTNDPGLTLRIGDARRIDELRNEFERAWSQGDAPRIEDYLSRLDDWLRFAAFGELLKSEINLRRERRELATTEEYVARFPDYAAVVRDVCAPAADAALAATIASPAAPVAGKRRSGLHVRCPNCHNPIELVPEAELEDIKCGSCGSDFSLTTDEDEATRDARSFAQVGHFKLVERLGMGAFGTVWKAQDTELDRTVAVKIPRAGQLDKQRQELFLREARSAAQLRHPNIVPVYEVGRDGDTLYIVSELVRGIPLSDRLTAGPLAAHEAAELCAKIAAALHHAHEQGVIHRDLKPANVMLDEQGEPHLMDFGLARREANEITMTMDGQVLGTPAYMSPEQAQGEAHTADRRSDVYSLGVILFELLTGELPFRGNARMLMHQVIHDEPPSPRKLNNSVPRDLETITLKCLDKDRAKRYERAGELADELQRFIHGIPILARATRRHERAAKWVRRNKAISALALAVALALLIGTTISTYFALNARDSADLAIAREQEASAAKAAELVAREQEQASQMKAEYATRSKQIAEEAESINRSLMEDLETVRNELAIFKWDNDAKLRKDLTIDATMALNARHLAKALLSAGRAREACEVCAANGEFAYAMYIAAPRPDLDIIAGDIITKAIAQDPGTISPKDAVVQGEICLVGGHKALAEAAMRSGIARFDRHYAIKSLGWCLLSQGRVDEARQAFEQCLRTGASYAVGRIFESRKPFDPQALAAADIDHLTAAYFLDLISEEQYTKNLWTSEQQSCFPWFYVGQRREIEGDQKAAIVAYQRCDGLNKDLSAHVVGGLARWRLQLLSSTESSDVERVVAPPLPAGE